MNLSEIKLHLYKVGTQILMGLHRFDHIIVTAEQALDLVQNDVWEDSPHKALHAAKSDEEKANSPAPYGMGLLTCLPEFDHAAHLAANTKKPAPQTNGGEGGTGTKPPAAPKAEKKAKGGAKPPKSAPPKTGAAEQKPEVAEDTNTGGEGEGDGAEGDNDGNSKEE